MTVLSLNARRLTCAAALLLSSPGLAADDLFVDRPPEEERAAASSPFAEALEPWLAGDEALAAFYRERGFAPVWTGAQGRTSAAAEALIAAIATAPQHGLPAGRYEADALAQIAAGLSADAAPADRAEFERTMTEALALWTGDMRAGLLVPSKIDAQIQRTPERPETAALLAGIAAATDPAAWLADQEPGDPRYAALKEGLHEKAAVVAAGGWGAPVPKGRTLAQGDRGPRVAALRERLRAMGDLTGRVAASDGEVIAEAGTATDVPQPETLGDPKVFDAALAGAVRAFQARHGLNTDGVVGPATLAALNVSAEERLGAIAVNLERMRWMNRDLGDRHVMVNIAGFTMALIDGGETVFESRVVVGKPRHQTPEFSDEMEHLVINPSWNVPRSIATKEILPKLRRDPGYLSRNNMQLIGAEPWFINWHTVTPSTFPGRIKQLPGKGNALGRVKFMFPNGNAIYLHDTPAKALFRRDGRAYSHGCVRVEKPFEFAYHLLAPQLGDPEGQFQRWLRSGRERWVNLDEHIPVHIGYRTAWRDADGQWQFRSDIYGRDGRVLAALEDAGVAPGL